MKYVTYGPSVYSMIEKGSPKDKGWEPLHAITIFRYYKKKKLSENCDVQVGY